MCIGLNKTSAYKKILIKTHENFDKNSCPIFMPRRAPRSGATGVKQLNSA